MSLEIHRMLALSTSHLSDYTCNTYLRDAARPDGCFYSPIVTYEKRDYGWFVHVPEDPADSEGADVPLELRSAIHVARREGCGWVMFDRDGPVIEELPVYDW